MAVEKKQMKTEMKIQYRELEGDVAVIVEQIKEHYAQKGYDPDTIEDLQVYMKPEDFTAYYVINDSFAGKVPLFQ